jgi:peptidoglycan/xylan/chitin deacetylase (PgdA/CDA1 family)
MAGAFVLSLDFELYWGVRDSKPLETYKTNILGVREAMPEMLALFRQYEVKATIAAVGLLFFDKKDQLTNAIPSTLPIYKNSLYNWFPQYLSKVGKNETEDLIHFGKSLIESIQNEGTHEIATHTFSHYYTLEEGADEKSFREDLKAARLCAQQAGIPFNTIIFPRNQYSPSICRICKEEGLKGFRGTEKSWLYKPKSRTKESKFRRLGRLADSYVNITGSNTYPWTELTDKSGLYNIPSSSFLRPYSKRFAFLDTFRLKRMKDAMTFAAKNNQIYHIWWHPHNFGINMKENIVFLRKLLQHYRMLHETYVFESHTMTECYNIIQNNEYNRK